jgi:hypothetical protein
MGFAPFFPGRHEVCKRQLNEISVPISFPFLSDLAAAMSGDLWRSIRLSE